jgi:hypothetical protein
MNAAAPTNHAEGSAVCAAPSSILCQLPHSLRPKTLLFVGLAFAAVGGAAVVHAQYRGNNGPPVPDVVYRVEDPARFIQPARNETSSYHLRVVRVSASGMNIHRGGWGPAPQRPEATIDLRRMPQVQ